MLCYEVQTFATESHSLIVSASPATLSHIFPADGVFPTAALLLPRLLIIATKSSHIPLLRVSLFIHCPGFAGPSQSMEHTPFTGIHSTLPTSLSPCYPLTSVDKNPLFHPPSMFPGICLILFSCHLLFGASPLFHPNPSISGLCSQTSL